MKVDTGLIGVYIAVNRNCPLTNSAMMSTLTMHCQWEDGERQDWPPAFICQG